MSLEQVLSKSWASLKQALGESRVSLERVSIKSQAGPVESLWSLGQVSGVSLSSPEHVPVEFRAGPVRSQVSSGQVPSRSRVSPKWVLTESWAGLDRYCWFENEILKVEKLFTIFTALKTINHFQKLKKNFQSKRKYFLFTIILRHTKHPKIRKTFSINHFTAKQMKP